MISYILVPSSSGTNKFNLKGSNDQQTWTDLAEGNLVNPSEYEDCDVPVEVYETGTRSFRYIMFTAEDFHNSYGPGLMYMAAQAQRLKIMALPFRVKHTRMQITQRSYILQIKRSTKLKKKVFLLLRTCNGRVSIYDVFFNQIIMLPRKACVHMFLQGFWIK